jgi:hypothetical protein
MEKLAAIKAEGNCKTKEEYIAGSAEKLSSFDNKNLRTESVFKSRFQPKIEILIKEQEETEILSQEPC